MSYQYMHDTIRYDDVNVTSLKNAIFARRKTQEFILPVASKFAGFKSS